MKGLLLIALVVLATTTAACASSGDEPVDDLTPSTTAPGQITTDSLVYDPATPDAELVVADDAGEEISTGETPAGELGRDGDTGEETSAPDDEKATVQDGTPNETRDPDVPVAKPTVPHANVVDGWPNQTRDPDVEIVMPQRH